MKLPAMKYTDGIGKTTQVKFGGYHHSLAAGDGEIYDMENMTSLYYPLLSPRPKRRLLTTLTTPNGIFGRDKLCWVDGTSFYYDGVLKGAVTDGIKAFAAIGAYIVIFPDKKYFNTAEDEFGSLESTYTGAATFQDGTLYEEAAEANTIYCSGVTWSDYFKVGDAVTISGCTSLTDNNKTPVIREIDGDEMHFYENVFENGTESAVTIKRVVPDMLYLCENENRLWGCIGNTIYASKLGDPFNWNVFDGLSTDSWSVDVGSAENFTGCAAFLGYPVFFKPGQICKIYGSIPTNFQVMASATMGIAEGSWLSPAIAGETLFYLSQNGPVAYTGGIPTLLGEAFGTDRYKNGYGGSDRKKYYLSLKDQEGVWHLFVYDTSLGLWHREDSVQILGFAYSDSNLYFLTDAGEIWITGNITEPPEASTEETDVSWYAEFGDFTEGSLNKKSVTKIHMRLEMDEGATITAYIKYDSDVAWTAVKTITAEDKQSYYLPILPKRSDHYRLKLTGTCGCRIYAMARETYAGSEL